jgi:hypothetical protein
VIFLNKKINEETQLMLDEFSVDFPGEEEIERTIMEIHQYVPKPKSKMLNMSNLKNLLLLSGREVLYISRLFWILNFVFLVFGSILTFLGHSNPYWTLFVLSPIPFVTGLIEVFKSRDHGLMELESSLKYSVQQVILSKLLIVGLFNFVLNVVLIAMFAFELHIRFNLTALLTYWVMPFTLVSSISLVISTKFRSVIASPILIAFWFALGLFISAANQSTTFIKDMGIVANLVVIVISVIIIVITIRTIKRGDFVDVES